MPVVEELESRSFEFPWYAQPHCRCGFAEIAFTVEAFLLGVLSKLHKEVTSIGRRF